jgi:hypothetical protein
MTAANVAKATARYIGKLETCFGMTSTPNEWNSFRGIRRCRQQVLREK